MAIIPGVHVDFQRSPRIITIPVAGSPVDVTIADLQDTLQDIEDDEQDGIVYPRLRDCSGGESLGGGRSVGLTMRLNDAQIMFEGQTTLESEGTATTDDSSGKILTDSTAAFVMDGVRRGHKIVNWTTGASAVVTEVISSTQLRHVVLSGGMRATWEATDVYRVFPIVKCSVSAGNLTAADSVGADLDPIMSSPNVYAQKESATSAALVEGSGGVTADECAVAVWNEQSSSHVLPGSMAKEVVDTKNLAQAVYEDIGDVLDIATDLHAEAFGKWVLDPVAHTFTLYREDGSVLTTFRLTATAVSVPAYVARIPL